MDQTPASPVSPARSVAGSYRYEAFISYRHVEPDNSWAKWVHRKLETYRVPARLRRERKLPARLRPIFQDTEELPASSDLGREINLALEQSRFLIVICSPRTPESEWVNREILRFRELGRHDQILAVLIEGEPEDAFPRALVEIRRVSPGKPSAAQAGGGEASGDPMSGRAPPPVADVEPLAADVRRHPTERLGHVRRMAELRLLACILGVRFDELRQREHERRARQWAVAGAGLVGLLVLVSVLALIALHERKIALAQMTRADIAAVQLARDAVEARAAEMAAKRALSDDYVRQGAAAHDAGDLPLGLLWYVRALETEPDGPGDAQRRRNHRLRIATTLHLIPQPVDTTERPPGLDPPIVNGKPVTIFGRDETMTIGEVGTGEPVAPSMTAEGGLHYGVFSSDGRRLVTGTEGGIVRVWETATAKPLTPPLVHRSNIIAVCFSDDARRVLSADSEGNIGVWDVGTGKAICPMLPHEGVDRIAFSPDGRKVLSIARFGKDVRTWDLPSGKMLTSDIKYAGDEGVLSAIFSPDGDKVATAGDRGTLRVWRAADGHALTPPMAHGGRVPWLAFSPEGGRVASLSSSHARLWDARTGRPLTAPIIQTENADQIAFGQDGRSILISSSLDQRTEAWRIDLGGLLVSTLRIGIGEMTGAAFSQDGKSILTTGFLTMANSGASRIWDPVTGHPLTPPLLHAEQIMYAELSPDGRQVVTASRDKSARVWDARTGIPLTPQLLHEGIVMQARFDPEGRRVVTACDAKTALVWDISDGPHAHQLGKTMVHGKGVRTACFSPDGLRVVTASNDGSARLWDAATGEPVGTPMEQGLAMGHACFSPDGRTILTATIWGEAALWSTESQKQLSQPMIHPRTTGQNPWFINAAVFSPDGRRVVTGGDDETARIWASPGGEALTPAMKHSGVVFDACFSPDGQWIATASTGGAQLWDSFNGQPVTPLLPHGDIVMQARFSPDGTRLVTACADGMARVWEFAPETRTAADLKELAEFLASRQLDAFGTTSPLSHDERAARLTSLRAKNPASFRIPPAAPPPADVLPAYRDALNEWVAASGKSDDGTYDSAGMANLLDTLSRRDMLADLPREAIAQAEKALALNPAAIPPRERLATSYLLAGDLARAEQIYLQNKDARYSRYGGPNAFSDDVLNDFEELRRLGLGRPEMRRIEALLATPSPMTAPATRPAN